MDFTSEGRMVEMSVITISSTTYITWEVNEKDWTLLEYTEVPTTFT
jgi:hypothetical protein